jgi:hypothetical protein
VPVVGQLSPLSAKAVLSNGTSQDVTAQATWSSSNNSVATVSTGGLLKVLQLGTATITATYQGVSGQFSWSLQFTVSPPSLTFSRANVVQTVTVTNTGSIAIQFWPSGGPTLLGLAFIIIGQDFANPGGTCGLNNSAFDGLLAPGATCTERIVFTPPQGTGSASGTFDVNTYNAGFQGVSLSAQF